jgi:hypothetical protein
MATAMATATSSLLVSCFRIKILSHMVGELTPGYLYYLKDSKKYD